MKILRSFIAFVAMAGIVSLTSCSDDWGKSDPTPGTDVYPVKEVVGTYNFEYADDVEALSDMSAKGDRISKHENVILEVVNDEALGSNVLHLDSGYVRMVNPFVGSKGLQNGAAITMWVKTDSVTLHSALFAFGDETLAEENISERFFFSENSWLSYTKPNQLETLNLDENNPEDNKTSAMTNDKSWHFVALQLKSDGYIFYVDGEKKAQQDVKAERTTQFSYSNLLTYLETAPYLYIGAGNDSILAETWIDDITIYRNMMDVKDWNKKYQPSSDDSDSGELKPVYFNDFSSANGATIVGGGFFRDDAAKGFGKVFQNVTGGMRQNYLLLPEDVLSHSAETEQMTIGFWVNAANAGESESYMWAPMFMAYGAAPVNGENGMPMFACQYRGVLQINNDGWTDYTDAQNVKGVNTLYHAATDWLADKKWHYYTVVFDGENAKVYFDGEIANEWNMDGVNNTQKGLFRSGSALKYICLGGNQAWNWGDNDPGFAFDDFAVYSKALSADDIKAIIEAKSADVKHYYRNNFESNEGLTIVGAGSFVDSGDAHGKVFQNATGGMRQNYLLLPEDLLSNSAKSQQLSIGFWVNAKNAGASESYMWAPMFMAYTAAPVNGENTLPMFACQYRGVLQVNNDGWTDYTDAQNVKGVNTLYHAATDWLADKEWHYYTVVLDGENAKVYFDGEIANEWNMDGVNNTQTGLFRSGSALKYICLGGNQAWNWGDNDPGFAFDDIIFSNHAFTQAEIQTLMSEYK